MCRDGLFLSVTNPIRKGNKTTPCLSQVCVKGEGAVRECGGLCRLSGGVLAVVMCVMLAAAILACSGLICSVGFEHMHTASTTRLHTCHVSHTCSQAHAHMPQVEMCTNGKFDAFEGASDCGFFCPRKCSAGQVG